MQEFIIGKEGQQAFEIKNQCVSRKHAKITIDNGRWTLEDLDSTNGTYIQDENGDFVQIKKVEISEFTRIALGSDKATGYFFYAHHLLEENGSYDAEMRHVVEIYNKLAHEKDEITTKNYKKSRNLRILPAIAMGSITVLLFIFLPEFRIYTGCIGSLLTVFSAFASNPAKHAKEMQKLNEIQSKLVRCPKCNRPLTQMEIMNEQCATCKTHT